MHVPTSVPQGIDNQLFCRIFELREAAATPADTTVERFLDVCEASTVQEAMVNGDKLDWQRLSNADIEEWRRNFVGYSGGSVNLVGWRHEREGGVELLSFWIAAGPDGHKACAFTTPRPAGFMDALSERLGAPDNLDKNDAINSVTALWKRAQSIILLFRSGRLPSSISAQVDEIIMMPGVIPFPLDNAS
ncbi:hypothetical protein [Rhizobium sp. AN88]|uniref:hypothetical protein n=1 Tax=Rhizobium sp. AN88 TaxID=3035215 RepID=UPI002B264035|nr:hypothetical protein [Rhizobium sp. AN88]